MGLYIKNLVEESKDSSYRLYLSVVAPSTERTFTPAGTDAASIKAMLPLLFFTKVAACSLPSNVTGAVPFPLNTFFSQPKMHKRSLYR